MTWKTQACCATCDGHGWEDREFGLKRWLVLCYKPITLMERGKPTVKKKSIFPKLMNIVKYINRQQMPSKNIKSGLRQLLQKQIVTRKLLLNLALQLLNKRLQLNLTLFLPMHGLHFRAAAAHYLPWNGVFSIQPVHLSSFPSILHPLQGTWEVTEMCWHTLSYEVILPRSRLFPNCPLLVFWVTSIVCHAIKITCLSEPG